ncbi:MAG: ATP-binding cassette domain-containing protein [Defluviitaleaceae bacterium]|nr:ATP-binding cassette domain-containing protein [Defluviitaleaceae bacterium]
MIKIEHVNKTFIIKKRNIHALQDISLEIKAGEIFGIIGYSGAGKSTLIRCINLLERPTTGSIMVDGEELTALSARGVRQARKKMGMIFQHFNLMPSRTALGNVLFALRKSTLTKEEKEKKARDLLELVGLAHRIHAYPSNLSGGEKQRVAIARALSNDPKVLLCDEATSALDPKTSASILKLLKEVSQKLQVTIVLITHSMDVIKEICDRVAVIEGGQLKEEGKVLDIFSHPKSDITKQFVSQSSGIGKIYELIEQDAPIVALEADEMLLKLTYAGGKVKDALIYHIMKEFDVKTSIIFGNVAIIQHFNIGTLVISCCGKQKNLAEAIAYMREQGVQVEVMKSC